MTVFLDTDFREHGARDLVEYLQRDRALLDRTGREMADEDVEAFVEQSEEYGFERQVIISPEHGELLGDRELSRATRQVMSEFCTDRPTATYCYAIHRDTDHPHTHVALTGTKRDLWMDRADCEHLRERAEAHFQDHHRELMEGEAREIQVERALRGQEYGGGGPA